MEALGNMIKDGGADEAGGGGEGAGEGTAETHDPELGQASVLQVLRQMESVKNAMSRAPRNSARNSSARNSARNSGAIL